MASPRKFRLKKRQIGGKVLDPVGLTQVATADLTDTTNLANLQDLGLYSYRGWEPSFEDGSRSLLSDAVSGGDGNWTLIGTALAEPSIVGETSAEAAGKIASDIHHFWMPAIGTDSGDLTSDQSYQCVVYSYDGPQADYSPYYLSLGNNATASLIFSNKITGAADGNEQLFVALAGSVNSSSAGHDKVEVYYNDGGWQLLADLTSSNAYTSIGAVLTSSVTDGFKIEFSSSAEQASSTTGVNGWLVVISGSTGL